MSLHFTGLRIAGFKSFVDPVEVAIEPGLTGVVGPNGCGKSNLLEAMRWVMGASSARAMRGGEMDDLIFSGSETRPARETAEVTLVLDNSSHSAPAEFNDEPVIEVRRALRRGAGSSYRLNGRTVRARDVQLLFSDASTGANSPALVRQGQISELIGAKPENRRRVLEEAAGIAGLAARRHEAELKLTAAEDNLSRVAEISAEFERQAASLRRQAARARKHRELTASITVLEMDLAARRWRQALDETVAARTALAEAGALRERTAITAARASTREAEARDAAAPLRAAEAEAAGRLGAAKADLARVGAEKKAAEDMLSALLREMGRAGAEIERAEAQARDAQERAARLSQELDALPPDDPAARDREMADARTRAETALTRLNEAEARLDALRRRHAELRAAAEASQAELGRERARVQRAEAELASLAREEKADPLDASGLAAAIADAKSRQIEAAARSDAAHSAAEAADAALDVARREEADAAPARSQADRRVQETEAELKGLERLLRPSPGGARPPVLDAVKAPRKLAKALAAALGSDLDAPIDSGAPAYWSGAASAMAQTLPEGVKPLSDLVDAPAELKARLAQCGLVEGPRGAELQAQLRIGQRLVSAEGDLWRWDGFVRTSRAPLPAAEVMAQRARRSELEAQLDTEKSAQAVAARTHADARARLAACEAQARSARQAVAEALKAAAETREAALRAEQASERLAMRLEARNAARARLEASRNEALAALKDAESRATSGPGRDDLAALGGAEARLREAREAERGAAAAIQDLAREHDRLAGRRRGLKREREEWAARARDLSRQAQALRSQSGELSGGLEAARAAPERLAAELDALAQRVAEADVARKAAADALAEAEAEAREAELESRAARDAAATARETVARCEAAVEAASRRDVEMAEAARAQYDCELVQLEDRIATTPFDGERPADPAACDALLTRLRRDREALGGVNLEADAQLEELDARLGVQGREKADLEAAIARLRQGVSALNSEGRVRLLAAFETVNTHFKALFQALFNGGEAELRLTESDDPLKAGLEIFASPPGKRLGTLSLMSGGEQALTATALIFAVFLSRPAPVCVLDEVDAPLDDANVDRFCRMLDEMRRRTATRFLVITHNAVTMSRMDRLYGVTMQERGVSRLVSVDLEAAERLAAA